MWSHLASKTNFISDANSASLSGIHTRLVPRMTPQTTQFIAVRTPSVRTLSTRYSFNGERMQHQQSLFAIKGEALTARTYATLPPHNQIGFPALSPSMEKGNLAKWRKKEGDKIKVSDVIAEIETDKATVDFESTEESYLAKILFPDGAKDIPVGTPLCITVEKAADVAAFKDYQVGGAAPKAAPAQPAPPTPQAPTPQAPAQAPAPPSKPTPEPQPTGKWVPGAPPPVQPGGASYLARATAGQSGVDLSQVSGTGPLGRIIQADVLEYKAKPAPATPVVSVPGTEFVDIPVTQIRKVIAERLTLSKQQIPHYYLTVDCRVDSLMKLRQSLNDKAKGEFKLSVNTFVLKAAALASKKIPEANSSWLGDVIRRYNSVDMNVAVNTKRGLMTPLLKDVEKIGLATINAAVKDLAERAEIGKLTPAELSSGTFTVSNLGMFGIKQFAAVINPPQACILAVGGTEKRVIVNDTPGSTNPYSVGEYLSVTLSCDHRVVDGAVGAEWLKQFREYIEDPTKMLL